MVILDLKINEDTVGFMVTGNIEARGKQWSPCVAIYEMLEDKTERKILQIRHAQQFDTYEAADLAIRDGIEGINKYIAEVMTKHKNPPVVVDLKKNKVYKHEEFSMFDKVKPEDMH